jgi:hypothetical protein
MRTSKQSTTAAEATGPARGEWIAIALIALAGVSLRAYQLGALSTWGDEETTGLAARALLDAWPPELPGGLVYVRALPFTLLEALAIGAFGDSAAALRLVPVLLAGPRLIAAWWLARLFVPTRYALAAAGILALSALDIEQSRNARMYSMLATFDLVAVAASLHAARGAKRFGAALGAGAIAIATHIIGVAHALVPWLAAFGRGLPARRRIALAALGASFVVCFLLARAHSDGSYEVANVGQEVAASSSARGPLFQHVAALQRVAGVSGGIAVLGAVAGFALGASALRRLPGWEARAAAIAALGAGAIASPVLAAIGLLALPPLAATPALTLLGAVWRVPAGVLLGLASWTLAALAHHGLSGEGLQAAAEFMLGLPAPNWYELVLSMPLLMLFAGIGAIAASDRGARAEQPGLWLALIGAAFAPALLSGFEARSGALRFQIHALGPLVVLAVLGAHWLAERSRAQREIAALAGLAAVALGVRPELGLAAITRPHGVFESPFHEAGVAPDHRGAAEFLLAHAGERDWIAAEDPLQQRFLTGRSDFWLRTFSDARTFLRRDPSDGSLRDIYTGSRQIEDVDALRALAHERGAQTLWIVTSGECDVKPEWYRNEVTRKAFEAWRPLAWFEGADGLTRVYRLEAGEPVPPPRYGVVLP